MDRPTVFISYSHDSPEHAERMRGLVASLERDGCTCRLDVYKDTAEDWPAWMTRQLMEADSVLCVVTETYEKRFHDQELPDVGRGVGWEAGLIRRLLYAQKLHNDRIFPIFFEPSDKQYIPLELVGYDQFLLDGSDGYESLLRKLLGRPLDEWPQPGPAPDLPIRTTKSLFDRPGGARLGGSGPIEPSLSGPIRQFGLPCADGLPLLACLTWASPVASRNWWDARKNDKSWTGPGTTGIPAS